MYRATLVVLVALLAICGSARADEKNQLPPAILAVLTEATRFEVFSLDPKHDDEKGKNAFHGYRILGSTLVKDVATRAGLIKALVNGVAENQGEVAGCFNPRHGISATLASKTVELVICFECAQINVYDGGKKQKTVLVSRSPSAAFNKVLVAAKVPLAPSAEKE